LASDSRPISAGHGVIRLADDKRPGRAYRDGMHLRLRPAVTGLRDKQHRDWIVAAVLAAASLLQLSLTRESLHAQVLGSVSATAVCTTVAFRQRYPTIAGVAAQAIMVLDFDTGHYLQLGAWTIAWWSSLYGLAVWSSRWRLAAGLAFAVCTDLLQAGRNTGGAVFNQAALGLAVGTVVVALLVRRIVGDRESKARLAERERDVAAREAVVEERARIARELHDAVAHHVSMMVIQAGAERRVLDDKDGKDNKDRQTHEVLQTIEQIGRGALTEMRRLVGMLRTDSADRLAPQPTLGDLPTLMSQVREAGLPVEFRVDGVPRALPVGIELSAYRIVQEALTNALKHAGQARATVHVAYTPDTLELEIIDDGAGASAGAAVAVPGGGHGLAGIQERVSLYGGKFDASAQRGGGFAVRVLLPTT
jgi:signal transduction histidine kinase